MSLLLDTQVFLWYFMDPQRIKRSAFGQLQRGDLDVFLSAASVWEIAIKSSINKLEVPGELSQYVRSRMYEAKFLTLPISIDHALAVRSLPPHHADPFDRILIAQAQVDGLTLVSADRQFKKYDVRMIAAR